MRSNFWERFKGAALVVVLGYLGAVALLSLCGLFVVHVVAHSSVGHADVSISRSLSHHRTPRLNNVTQVLSWSADTIGAVALAMVASIVLALRRLWRYIVMLVVGLGFELATFLLVNHVVNRPRPHVAHLGSLPFTSSFPSGHVAATFVIYACVALFVRAETRSSILRSLSVLAAVVMPLAVAVARVYRGMHYPLDTLGGLLLGAITVAVVFTAFDRGTANADAKAPSIDDHILKAVA